MNKLKVIIASLLSFCFLGSAVAQDVIYSPYEKFDFRSGDFSVVGKINGLLYTYRGSSDGYFLDAYNDSMGRTATVVLDFFPQKIYDTHFITYSDKILVLYQGIEGVKVVQYAALLDGSGRLKKGPISLSTAKTSIFGPTRTYFSSAVSDDKKNIVVYSAHERGRELEFDAKWIDDELNIVHRGHTVYKGDNDLAHGEGMVGNDGSFYLPCFTPVGGKGYADELSLLVLPYTDTKFTSVDFPLNNQYATSTYLKMDNVNSRIYTGGFYSDKKNGSYKGVLYGYYDIAGKSFQNSKEIPFDSKLLSETGDHNKKRAFDNFQVRQLIVKNDGGFVMVSEDFYITNQTSYVPGFGYYSFYYNPYMTQYIREYHYNDIMALAYDGQGNRQWDAFVYKDQYSQEDGGLFSSYVLLNTGGSLGFLYNDFNPTNSQIQFATVDADGKVNIRSFTTGGKNYPDWMPRSGKQVSAREMVVPCLQKKQICFAKVIF